MTFELIGLILKEHGIYVFAISVLGWAYWQERKENRDMAKASKEDDKQMIVALIEVRDALRAFKEETRPRR